MTTQAIWDNFGRELDAFIRRRVPNHADAEDLRQQVYLNLHRHLQQNPPPADVRAWVYRIARNAVIDHARRRAARRLVSMENPDALGEPSLDDEAQQTARGLGRCLLRAVEAMPEPYGSALRATQLEGQAHAEAAAEAGVSLTAMKSRIRRGRAQLRRELLACCEVELDGRQQPIAHRCRRPDCGCDRAPGDAAAC